MSLDTQLQSAFTAVGNAVKGKISSSEKGAANGVATLDGSGKIPAAQMPGSVDQILEYANLAAFPATGTVSYMYLDLSNGKVYRWSGSVYVEMSPSEVNSVNGMTGAVTIGVSNISGLQGQLDGKASTSHTHAIGDVTGLQTALDGKATTAALSALSSDIGATNTDYVAVLNAAMV